MLHWKKSEEIKSLVEAHNDCSSDEERKANLRMRERYMDEFAGDKEKMKDVDYIINHYSNTTRVK